MKNRGFVVTDWNCNDENSYKDIMDKNSIQFLAFGKEICPKSGKKHHQCFLYFINPKSCSNKNLNNIGNYFGEIHCYVQVMRGSFTQNEAYCKKEGSYEKLGDEPKQGARSDIKENVELIMKGDLKPINIALMDPGNYNLYKNTYNVIFNKYMLTQYRTEMTKGVWYWGETGVGKSHKAFRNFTPETHYIKDLNVQWWDNYEQQPIVVLNEFRGQIKFGELLDLVDKWPKTVPVRNNPSIPFTSKKLIITSSKPPNEIYSNCGESLTQLLRRFTVRHLKMEKKYSVGNIRPTENLENLEKELDKI